MKEKPTNKQTLEVEQLGTVVLVMMSSLCHVTPFAQFTLCSSQEDAN